MRLPSSAQRRSLQARVDRYRSQVGPEARRYWISRGLNDETAERFQLGYVPRGEEGGIGGRLAVPYLTPAGPLGVKFRCIRPHNCKDYEHHQKYLADSGAEQFLFNAQTLLTATRVVLVEGETDVMSIEQLGVPAVGYPGTGNWTANQYWRWCFDSVDEVIVVSEGDKAGRESGAAITKSLRDAVKGEIRNVELPEKHDSNSLIQAEGPIEFMDRLGLI